jgi:tRNA modification GTPase
MTTIFAPITSSIKSGVTLIRISGPQTINCLDLLGFKGTPTHQKVSFQKIIDPQNGHLLDECLITFFQAPQSFTGEDVAEISIHASSFIAKRIFQILSEQKNVRFAEAGEFSKRAFLNGKFDLTQAEAIPDLIAAETAIQHRQALEQLSGKLGEIYENWREKIISILAQIEALIDFPDEDLPADLARRIEAEVTGLRAEISSHLNDNKIGQKIKNGLSLAIIGAPNSGKSSLINFLAQSEIAIVSNIPGTTRDIVETHLEIGGIPVKIADTAGIRDTEDLIEKEGIKRALNKAKSADLKILMISAEKIDDEIKTFLAEDLVDNNTLIIINKIDLTPNFSLDKFVTKNLPIMTISITRQINLDKLIAKLESKILELLPDFNSLSNTSLITQERYRTSLTSAVENLRNFSLTKNIELAGEDLRLATREIGKITGKIDIENIFDVIFSRFCIGK